jgi:hypothetical protein
MYYVICYVICLILPIGNAILLPFRWIPGLPVQFTSMTYFKEEHKRMENMFAKNILLPCSRLLCS